MTRQQALQRLTADIRLRGLSSNTHRLYTACVRKFLDYSATPVGELDEIDVRKYLSYLLAVKKLEPGTVNIHSAAIRFFFAVTLNRTMNCLQIPRVKAPKKLPEILTRDEAAELIARASTAKHKA